MTAQDAKPIRPARPARVELAAAILIIGGIVGLIQVVASATAVPVGAEPFLAGTVALDAGSIAIGLLIRTGRAWLLAVNQSVSSTVFPARRVRRTLWPRSGPTLGIWPGPLPVTT